MPTYEYKCDTCNIIFEEFQSITQEPLTQCRTEGCKGKVHRIISSGAGFLFKGSGFYTTDYRSDSYKKKASAEKSNTSSSTEKKAPKSAKTTTKESSSAK